MTSYFYFDSNNQKRGPYSEVQQLQELVDHGIITPTTQMETDGGHRGMAGQIPVLKFATVGPPPKQFFCTNCGSTTSEQAVACMSCGAKPTGHRKFCRQCGAGVSPEQVVCTKCGAGVGGVTRPSAASSASQQLFCTNCGSTASEQVIACMSCGAKPTGHKKFCRQCGVPLSSEQVVCVKCGASTSATRIPDAKQMMQSVISSSNIAIIKKVVIWAIIIALVLGLGGFAVKFALSWGGNPLKKAKQGDWVRYDVSVDGRRESSVLLFEILSNDGKKVKIRTSDPSNTGYRRGLGGTPLGMPLGMMFTGQDEFEIDLTMSPKKILTWLNRCPITLNNKKVVNIVNGRTSKETLQAAGQSFNCVVTPFTITLLSGTEGETLTITCKTWMSTSKAAPVGGMIKMEIQTKIAAKNDTRTSTMTMTLDASSNKT